MTIVKIHLLDMRSVEPAVSGILNVMGKIGGVSIRGMKYHVLDEASQHSSSLKYVLQ